MASRRSRQHRACEPSLKAITTFIACSDSSWWIILVHVPIMIVCPFAGLEAAEAQEASEPLPTEFYISGFVTRNNPIGSDLSLADDKIPHTHFGGSTGGGVKAGAFINRWGSIFGVELEGFGHEGKIEAPQTTIGGVTRSAQLDMALLNLMANAIIRYPGDLIQPYIGCGIGFSLVHLDGFSQSSGGTRSSSSLFGGAVQAIAGVRVILTNHLFGFAEYKHAFSWTLGGDGCESGEKNCVPEPIHNLNYQSHYVSVGLGFRF